MQFLQDWGEFLAAFGVFFLSHMIPVRPRVKSALVGVIGRMGFIIAYSTLSIVILGWIIAAAGRAPYVQLWPWAPWQNLAPLIGMVAAFILVALALGRPNPLSFGGAQNHRFDPGNPGIIGWFHHPLLAALLIWSAAHILPNGNLAHVIVFGLFAGFSLLGRKIINRRNQRLLGQQEWQRLSATKRQITPGTNGLIRLTLGLLAYLAVLYSHAWVIGVTPFL